MCVLDKPIFGQGNCRDTVLLEFDAVVDKPRCTTPSVSSCCDDGIALAGQCFLDLFRFGW